MARKKTTSTNSVSRQTSTGSENQAIPRTNPVYVERTSKLASFRDGFNSLEEGHPGTKRKLIASGCAGGSIALGLASAVLFIT